jgi:hypothetical protein
VNGENSRAKRDLSVILPNIRLLFVAIHCRNIIGAWVLPVKPRSARHGNFVFVIHFKGLFVDLIRKRHFSGDAVLVHVTKVFVLQAI